MNNKRSQKRNLSKSESSSNQRIRILTSAATEPLVTDFSLSLFSSATEDSISLDQVPYCTDYKHIGHVLIINYDDYKNSKIPQRKWCGEDADALERTFQNLGFLVGRLDNPALETIKSDINNLSKHHAFTDSAMLFICILAYGSADEFHTLTNTVNIHELIDPICHSRQWANKPKVFIVQTDTTDQQVVKIDSARCEDTTMFTDHAHNTNYCEQPKRPVQVPHDMDQLMVYSRRRFYGNEKLKGSIFIQALCREINDVPKREFTMTIRQVVKSIKGLAGNDEHLVPGWTTHLTHPVFIYKM